MHIYNNADIMLQSVGSRPSLGQNEHKQSGRKADVLETWLPDRSGTNILGFRAGRKSNMLTLT